MHLSLPLYKQITLKLQPWCIMCWCQWADSVWMCLSWQAQKIHMHCNRVADIIILITCHLFEGMQKQPRLCSMWLNWRLLVVRLTFFLSIRLTNHAHQIKNTASRWSGWGFVTLHNFGPRHWTKHQAAWANQLFPLQQSNFSSKKR